MSDAPFGMFPPWWVGASDSRPYRFMEAHDAEQPPKISVDPVADKHVVEHLNPSLTGKVQRLDVSPAARLKALRMSHCDDEIGRVLAVHGFEREKVFEGGNLERCIAVAV